MKIKIRNLVNPLILNDEKYVGFIGDSEYKDENNNVVMGYWEFISILSDNLKKDDNLKLDDVIDERDLFDIPLDECMFEIENDKGKLCLVKFIYGDEDDEW